MYFERWSLEVNFSKLTEVIILGYVFVNRGKHFGKLEMIMSLWNFMVFSFAFHVSFASKTGVISCHMYKCMYNCIHVYIILFTCLQEYNERSKSGRLTRLPQHIKIIDVSSVLNSTSSSTGGFDNKSLALHLCIYCICIIFCYLLFICL